MDRIADRISTIAATVQSVALGAAIACCAGWSGQTLAQAPSGTPPPKPASPVTFSGCVQKAPGSNSTLVISAPTTCAKLKGKFSDEKLAGHQVELKGVLTPRTASTPGSIEVDSVIRVGQSCSDVCSLQPPGTRGLQQRNYAIPGSEGGTPGITAPPPH